MDHSRYGRRTPSAAMSAQVKKAETDSLTGIQLNDRQMKLYAARKAAGNSVGMKEKNHKLAPPLERKKTSKYGGYGSKTKPVMATAIATATALPMQQPYLGREPTQTDETMAMTFSEDSASHASSSHSRMAYSVSSRNEKSRAFYGQRLEPQERKMYDDLGNTWKDSQSEASSAAASAVSAALSRASKVSSSSKASVQSQKSSSSKGSSMARLRQLNLQRSGKSKNSSSASSSAGSTYSSTSSSARSAVSSSKSVKMNSDSRSVVSAVSRAPSTASSTLKKKLPVAVAMPVARARPVAVPVAKAVAKKPATRWQKEKEELVNEIASAAAESCVSASTSTSSRAKLAPIDTGSHVSEEERPGRPSGLGTQKEKSKFLRKTMMQWAKPSASSSSLDSTTSATTSALKSTTSSASVSSRSSSRRLSFAPKKSIITTTEYRSPTASKASGSISPKEMAIMRKVAERNKNKAKAVTPIKKTAKAKSPIKSLASKALSPSKKLRRSSKISNRMKKLLSSSSSSISSSSSSLNLSSRSFVEEENDDEHEQPYVETVTSTQSSTLYDDRGKNVNEDAKSLVLEEKTKTPVNVNESKSDVVRSLPFKNSFGSRNSDKGSTTKLGEVDRRTPIILEEDMDNEEDDENVIARNQAMRRKKSKRGRSSIFKSRINHIGMAVMDDLIEENVELSSDEDETDYEDEDQDENDEEEVANDAVSDYQNPADVSLKPARSIKSRIGETPRDINSVVEEHKDFLKVMREGPLKQAKEIPGLVYNNPTKTESYDEEKEEYKAFTKTLRAELSGTHSKLYDSFQAMFRGAESDGKKAKPLSVYPGSLDLKTKEAISSMSKYLNTEHDVECVLGSQIVKDSDVRNFVFRHTSKTPRNAALKTYESDDDYGSIRQVPSTDSINSGAGGSEFEVSLGQHQRKSESVASSNDSRFLQATASKVTVKQGVGAKQSSSIFKLPASAVRGSGGTSYNKVKLKSRSSFDKNKSDSEPVPSSWTKVRLRPVVKTDAKSDDSVSSNTDSSEAPEFHRIVLRKTPTNAGGAKKNFDLALKTAPSSLTDTSGSSKKPIDIEQSGVAPDQPIKLTGNGVTPMSGTSGKPIELKDKLTPMSGMSGKPIELKDKLTPMSGMSGKPIELKDKLTPMSGMSGKPIELKDKLTPMSGMSGKPIELTPMSGTSGKPIELTDTRKGGEDNPIKLAPSVGYEGNPIQLVPSQGEQSASPIQLAPSIDLDLNEGSVMISLDKEAEAGDDVEISVLVGKNGITKVQSTPGQESTKANVIWQLERKEVKSALLDMSSFHVKVIVSSDNGKDHKDLKFPTSAQCMRFANALHEMKNNNDNDLNESKIAAGSDDTSVYVEQLSNDEQKVLDEFRQRKKNNPAPPASKQQDGKDFAKELLSKKLGATNKPMSVVDGATPSSPVSEVSAATTEAPLDESKTAMKYQLMLKTKVPKEAVKHKMEQDGVDPSIIAMVLRQEAPKEPNSAPAIASSSSNLSPDEEKAATTYRTMLKMGIPPEAVAHKMKKDGVDQKIVSAVLDGSDQTGPTEAAKPQAKAPAPPTTLTVPEQAAAQKYQKMLKMCIPKEAVEHKMKKDGADPKIIAYVLGLPQNSPADSSVPAKSKKSSSSLTSEEESTAAMYRRMLKMNIPKDAVRQKMMMNGISDKIVAAVLGNDKNAANKPKGGFNKTGFHWNPIEDDVSIAGSVWSKAGSSVAALELISKHVEEFQKKEETVKEKKVSNGVQGKKELAKLVKLERAQNVAITLKAFKDCSEKGSYKELAQIIEFLDPFGKIKGDRALFLKDVLPKPDEVKTVKSYTGSQQLLIPAERWFQQIVHIKRIEQKVEVMRTMETFKMDALVLGKSFQLLTDVCNQVMDSDRLPDLLDMVRQIGNRMNKGRGDDAAGFKLDFLPRLAQTKGSDKKTTALDLVILIFCTRNQREALMLSDDFPDIQEASRTEFADLTTDVKKLETSLRKCELEFDNLKKEHESELNGELPAPRSALGGDGGGLSLMDQVKARNGTVKPDSATAPGAAGLSLIDQIKARCGATQSSPSVREVHTAVDKSNEQVRKSLSPRESLLTSFSEANNGKMEFSMDASIRRLEKFVGEANYVTMPQLESQRAAAVEACQDLASFFCEKGGERAASKLLEILAGFAANIDHSVRKYDEQQKILARKEATFKKKKKMKTSSAAKSIVSKITKMKDKTILSKSDTTDQVSTNKPPPVPVAAGEKKSIVLMVNEMLKVAGDKEIDDFVAGKKVSNPDSRLQQIYEAEETRTSNRGDILSAIQKRRSMSINPVPDQALSDLRATLSEDARDDSEAGADKRRKSRIVNRWSSSRRDPPTKPPQDPSGSMSRSRSTDMDDDTSSVASSANEPINRKKSRVVSRWSSRPQTETVVENAESEVDFEVEQKRRQSIVNRWASRSPISEATTKDLDEESDIGAFQDMINQRRQKTINRWSSRKN